jgi:DNA repair exonuclease SbcCD ATPase subunit
MKHWDKVITCIITAVIAGVVSFYSTIFSVVDRIDRSDEAHLSEVAAIREELNRDRTDALLRISQVENRLVKIEECISGRLKPKAADVESLKITIELLKRDITELRSHYSGSNQLSERLNSIDAMLSKALAGRRKQR